ncbi:MAG: VTT domain-containing protein [Chitinophagaceae bacterium]|nr:VTT domain-containing protein [Chitinophagaceae bacterium]
MFKSIIGLAIGLLLNVALLAQENSLTIKITDQYEVAVSGVQISINGETTNLVSDKNGYCTIEGNPSDSVRFWREGHRDFISTLHDMHDNSIIVLKKDFVWKDLVNPMFYIVNGGLWLLLFIVFAETGLFIGFFLPGDSLLFVAGIYSSNLVHELLKTLGIGHVNNEWVDLIILTLLVSLAGILGNLVGYWFGKKIGPAMYNWKDRFLFKKKYLHDAHDFYEKYGGGAIVFARFLPIIRTFAPIVAGIVQMNRKKFVFFNIVGSIAWVVSMIFAGHFLQLWVRKQFGFELRDHLELIVIIIILVTTFPVFWKLLSGNKKQPKQ